MPSGKDAHKTSVLEWVVAVAGALIVVLAAGYMTWSGFRRQPQAVPTVTIETDSVQQAGAVWLVRFTATNEGGQTASRLVVEGTLRDGDSTVERATATLDYLPARSRREGGLFFQRDPRALRLEIVPRGYQLP